MLSERCSTALSVLYGFVRCRTVLGPSVGPCVVRCFTEPNPHARGGRQAIRTSRTVFVWFMYGAMYGVMCGFAYGVCTVHHATYGPTYGLK
jgi:hypothetical protein